MRKKFLFFAFFVLISCSLFSQVTPATMQQIQLLLREKNSRTPTQLKIDCHLLQAVREHRGEKMVEGVNLEPAQVNADFTGRLKVDIKADVTDAFLSKIEGLGGKIIFASAQYHTVRATISLTSVETIAGYPEVKFIEPAVQSMVVDAGMNTFKKTPTYAERVANVRAQLTAYLNAQNDAIGSKTSEGDADHRAADVRTTYGFQGAGIKIGVLSDSYNAKGGAAADVASGDLPGTGNPLGNTTPVTVVQDYSGGDDEGRAMLQVVHDLAPKATLYFATADVSEAGFATNIQTLRNTYGCNIIIDDVAYFDEPAFQDGITAQAVDAVTAAGALYFSSAGNSGSLVKGTSGVFEGDFNDAGSATFSGSSKAGTIHNFGTVSTPVNGDIITAAGEIYNLNWSDAWGASSNDYDLFLVSKTGTVKGSSTNAQTGTQNPYEQITAGTLATGDRLVVFKATAAAVRALHLNTNRGTLTVATNGQTTGHADAINAFCMAATPATTAFTTGYPAGPYPNPFVSTNKVEPFSSDGPRKIFYTPTGAAITAGSFTFASGGGTTLAKPDLTAADGVTTTFASSTGLSPFFGTSCAAPHAGAIAALLLSGNPSLTPAQVRTILTSTALDIEGAGYENNSGYGIIQAFQAAGQVTPTSCGVPTGETSSSITSSTATVNWSAVSGGNNYDADYKIHTSSTWTNAATATTAITLNLTGLTPSTLYDWRVRSNCASGTSAYDTAQFTTLVAPCNAPTGMATASIANTTATFNWTAVSGSTGYNIQYRVVGTSTWSTGTSATNSYNATGLTAGANYEWQVQNICSATSTSAFTVSTTFTTTGGTCTTPTGMATASIANTTATFNWTAVSGSTGYNIQYRVVGTSTWSTGTSATNSYNATGLTAGANYEWQVQNICSATSTSAFTASTTFTTTSTCTAPTGMATASIANTTATFNWTAVSGSTGYNIQYRVVGTSTWSTGTSATNSYNATGLTAGANYEWQVQNICSATSTSAFTASTTFTTTGGTVTYCTSVGENLDGITNVTFNTINNTTSGTTTGYTDYTATQSTTVNQNGTYQLTVKINTGGNYTNYAKAWIDWNHDGTFSTTTEEYNLGTAVNVTSGNTTLSPLSITVPAGAVIGTTRMRVSTQYNAAPTPCNASFDGEVEDYSIVVAASGACNIPSGLAAGTITSTSAALSWTSTGASSYNLQWKLSSGSTWTTVSGLTTASYNLTGLTASTAYQFQVQSVCGATTSAYSSAVSFTTSSATITYCASKGTSTTYEYINKVALGSISNTSGNNSGYGNYTALSTTLAAGVANTITLTPGFASTAYTEYWTVYIDYNQDGTLNGTGETVATGSGTAAISKSFTVPITAKNGSTRMRIQMHYGSSSTNPCATLDYGEVEDYTVNITGGSSSVFTGNEIVSAPQLSSLSIVPNPISKSANATAVYNLAKEGNTNIRVIDLTGRTIYSENLGMQTAGQHNYRLNNLTGKLNSGYYLVVLEQNNEIVARTRFVAAN